MTARYCRIHAPDIPKSNWNSILEVETVEIARPHENSVPGIPKQGKRWTIVFFIFYFYFPFFLLKMLGNKDRPWFFIFLLCLLRSTKIWLILMLDYCVCPPLGYGVMVWWQSWPFWPSFGCEGVIKKKRAWNCGKMRDAKLEYLMAWWRDGVILCNIASFERAMSRDLNQ